MTDHDSSSFDDLMARVKAGDQEAATALFNRYAHALVALARSRLDQQLRPKLDPEDVMQSVWKSFFVRYVNGQYDVGGWDSLMGLLVVITLRKCSRKREYYQAARRDPRREVPAAPFGEDSDVGWEAVARDPSPPEAAMLAQTLEQVLANLEGRERQIVSLALQGYSHAEISAEVGRTERTVQRVLARVKRRLERMRDEPPAD
jgi:RNA polymerase sigma-70 factor (ECF subfamily)